MVTVAILNNLQGNFRKQSGDRHKEKWRYEDKEAFWRILFYYSCSFHCHPKGKNKQLKIGIPPKRKLSTSTTKERNETQSEVK